MSEEVVEQKADVEEIVAHPNIFTKMVAVMGAIETLPKNGWNDYSKYHYVTDEDVMNYMRKALSTAGLAVVPRITRVEEQADHVSVEIDLTFCDGETGETVTAKWVGGALKKLNDKAVTVAATAAVKYCLLKTFLVSTGDEANDGDSDIAANKPQQSLATDKQKGAIAAMLNKLAGEGKRANVDAALQAQNFPPLAQLTKEQASQLFKRLEAKIAEKENGESPNGDPF